MGVGGWGDGVHSLLADKSYGENSMTFHWMVISILLNNTLVIIYRNIQKHRKFKNCIYLMAKYLAAVTRIDVHSKTSVLSLNPFISIKHP